MKVGQHDVGGLEVAVDDAVGMGLGEALEGLAQDVTDPLRRHRPRGLDHLAQSRPAHVLHRVVEQAVAAVVEVVDADGVGVRQVTHRHDLAAEALGHLLDLHGVSDEHLQRHLAVHGQLSREVDGAEAALPEQRFDAIGAVEDVAGLGEALHRYA